MHKSEIAVTSLKSYRWGLLVVTLLIPWVVCLCECVCGYPISDSSVFRYMGWRYATGTGGYAHAWDCKGPVLILLNALGYCLGISPSVVFAGLWTGTIFLFNRLLKKLHIIAAEGWTLLFVFAFFATDQLLFLNGTEAIAAFFSLLAITFVCDTRSEARWMVVGGAAATVFFTKPNLISFAAALGLTCAFESARARNFWHLVKCFLFSLVGFGLVFVFVGLAFGCNGYREMWDATLGYNLLERCAGIKLSWRAWWMDHLFRQKWYLVSAAQFCVWLVMGVTLIGFGCGRILRSGSERKPIYLAQTLWLSLEMAMVFVSKGFYSHYTTVSLVPMFVLLGLCFSDSKTLEGVVRRRFVHYFLVVACLPLVLWCMRCIIVHVRDGLMLNPDMKNLAKVVPSDSRVAVCGSHATSEIMTRLKLTTDQKYFGWLFYKKNCSDERRKENETSFRRSLETSEWLLSEMDMGNVASSMGFDFVFKNKNPNVFVYKKTGRRTADAAQEGRKGD